MQPGTLNFVEPSRAGAYTDEAAGGAYRGDTFRRQIRLRAREVADDGTVMPGPYLNLTGWTGRAQLRQATKTAAAAATMTVTVLDQQTTPGGLQIEMAAAVTETLTLELYGWDLKLTQPDGDVDTYLRGQFAVEQGYTRLPALAPSGS